MFFPASLAVAVCGRVDWTQQPFPGPNYWGLRAEDLFEVGSLNSHCLPGLEDERTALACLKSGHVATMAVGSRRFHCRNVVDGDLAMNITRRAL